MVGAFKPFPVAVFSIEQIVYTELVPLIFDGELNGLIGIPELPEDQKGQCFQVCGDKGCDFLHAVKSPSDFLTLTESVAKDILKSNDDFNVDIAYISSEPVGSAACEESKTLKKRQYYDYPPPPEHYLEVYPPSGYGASPASRSAPPSQPPPPRSRAGSSPAAHNSRNIKIQNDNTGNAFNKPEKVAIHNSQNLPSRAPERAPVADHGAAPARQVEKHPTLNHETPPSSAPPVRKGALAHEASPPQAPVPQAQATDELLDPIPRPRRRGKGRAIRFPLEAVEDPLEVSSAAQVEAVGIDVAFSQPQVVGSDEPVHGQPIIKKIEHPDGSVEYKFEVTSGEFSIYNEGEPVKKFPAERKNSIFGLKKTLGMDNDEEEMGWFKSLAKRSLRKRAIIPDNKPTAKNYPPPPPEPVPAYQRKLNNKFGYAPEGQCGSPAAPQGRQKQIGHAQYQGPTEEEIHAQLLNQQQEESDRIRRHSLKAFYRDMAEKGNNFEAERDKEMEKRIKEESDRIATELIANPQYRQQLEQKNQQDA